MSPNQIKRQETSSAAPPYVAPLTYTAPRRRKPGRWFALGAAILLLVLGLLAGAFWVRSRLKSEAAEPKEPSTIPSFPEGQFPLLDSDLGLIWLPILEDVPRETYNSACFFEQNGLKHYDDGVRRSVVGVDVSEFQGEVDWNALADAGVEYAMIRVGWRGYVSGSLGEDEAFIANIEGARDAGLQVGVYFFSQATSVAEAEEEAAFVLERIRGYDVTFPVVYDWEDTLDPEARTDGMTGETATDCAAAFCRAVERAGYRPCVYFYKWLAYRFYDLSRLSDFEFWLSEPNDLPEFYYDFSMWQYEVQGTLPGVDEPIDLNLCFVPAGSAD